MFGKRILSCYKGTADYDLMNVVFVNNNRLLLNLACSGRTGEYWPEVVAVRTE